MKTILTLDDEHQIYQQTFEALGQCQHQNQQQQLEHKHYLGPAVQLQALHQ